jgi:hypothetical protein
VPGLPPEQTSVFGGKHSPFPFLTIFAPVCPPLLNCQGQGLLVFEAASDPSSTWGGGSPEPLWRGKVQRKWSRPLKNWASWPEGFPQYCHHGLERLGTPPPASRVQMRPEFYPSTPYLEDAHIPPLEKKKNQPGF